MPPTPRRSTRAGRQGRLVDAVESKIREQLELDARMPATVIAERVGCTRSTSSLLAARCNGAFHRLWSGARGVEVRARGVEHRHDSLRVAPVVGPVNKQVQEGTRAGRVALGDDPGTCQPGRLASKRRRASASPRCTAAMSCAASSSFQRNSTCGGWVWVIVVSAPQDVSYRISARRVACLKGREVAAVDREAAFRTEADEVCSWPVQPLEDPHDPPV